MKITRHLYFDNSFNWVLDQCDSVLYLVFPLAIKRFDNFFQTNLIIPFFSKSLFFWIIEVFDKFIYSSLFFSLKPSIFYFSFFIFAPLIWASILIRLVYVTVYFHYYRIQHLVSEFDVFNSEKTFTRRLKFIISFISFISQWAGNRLVFYY